MSNVFIYNLPIRTYYTLMVLLFSSVCYSNDISIPEEIWIDTAAVEKFPTLGPAWDNLVSFAEKKLTRPDLSNQNDPSNVIALAKALAFVRTHHEPYRQEVIRAVMSIMGTESHGSTLSLGREIPAYIIAADLVELPEEQDRVFKAWLKTLLQVKLRGRTLISTHEERPNNWGTHAGAARAAIAAYLKDEVEFRRSAMIFRGWLGDRRVYSGFRYKRVGWWQANPLHPVGINPAGSTKQGFNIDGVLPEEQRRSGPFVWPPAKENYCYEALQGAIVQAVLYSRAGFETWEWSNKALLRSVHWLYDVAEFPAIGDDVWLIYLVNYYYDEAHFTIEGIDRPGKNMGWTSWTHQPMN